MRSPSEVFQLLLLDLHYLFKISHDISLKYLLEDIFTIFSNPNEWQK
jgi:hypothetical protein